MRGRHGLATRRELLEGVSELYISRLVGKSVMGPYSLCMAQLCRSRGLRAEEARAVSADPKLGQVIMAWQLASPHVSDHLGEFRAVLILNKPALAPARKMIMSARHGNLTPKPGGLC